MSDDTEKFVKIVYDAPKEKCFRVVVGKLIYFASNSVKILVCFDSDGGDRRDREDIYYLTNDAGYWTAELTYVTKEEVLRYYALETLKGQ